MRTPGLLLVTWIGCAPPPVEGTAFKGPMVGTVTTDEVWGSDAHRRTVTTETDGSWSSSAPSQGRFASVTATGVYFDEVAGEDSEGEVTLLAFVDPRVNPTIHVNVLSHIHAWLVMGQFETGTAGAMERADDLDGLAFGPPSFELSANPAAIDPYGGDDDAAYLLALSVTMLATARAEGLTFGSFLEDFTEDFGYGAVYGVERLAAGEAGLDLAAVRTNLEARYDELGIDAEVPAFESMIDADDDGVTADSDPDDHDPAVPTP